MPSKPRILILGAGVIGLTTALTLQSRGHQLRLWARDVPPNTTSDAAGAIWYPYLCGPADKVPGWSRTGLERFNALANGVPAAGSGDIQVRIFSDSQPSAPAWHEMLTDFAVVSAASDSEYPWMQTSTVPLVDVRVFMPYLVDAVTAGGTVIEGREVRDIDDALAVADVVINCTGLGSRVLMGDEALHPVRGQTVRVACEPPQHALIDDDGHNALAYVFPRRGEVLVGGTHQVGDDRLEPDADDTAGILSRAAHLFPSVQGATVLGVKVGLRPARDSVRLEAEDTGHGWLIHNYGHGGAGFTLSWGCADEVADIVDRITR